MNTTRALKKLGRDLFQAFRDFFSTLVFSGIKKIPLVSQEIQKQKSKVVDALGPKLRPYDQSFTIHRELPEEGLPAPQILESLRTMSELEDRSWKTGKASGAVYHGQSEHIELMNQVTNLFSQTNPLHADLWPSLVKFESEIVAMTANLMKAPEPFGTVTSGGTESILLAMKTYRDLAHKNGVESPEIIAPVTAHAAFDKAAQYFGIRLVKIPIDSNCQVNPQKVREAITPNTIVMVGSAPGFPHGLIDPIEELSSMALENGIPFHTDACLGGYVLPFARKLGRSVAPFDFSLPGVTSISIDTHKYGYAPKGTSVILYRTGELRRLQYFKTGDWPGGMYFSPTFAGSRPGALSAACWTALVTMGEKGYLQAVEKILKTADAIKNGIREIPELEILGDPLWVISFRSNSLDIYRIMEEMGHGGWSLNGLHRPACVHICVTLRHTQDGVAESFLKDLRSAVEKVKSSPKEKGQMAPIYGMAAQLPDQEVITDLLDEYIDLVFKVPEKPLKK